jgi:hypothetical protein
VKVVLFYREREVFCSLPYGGGVVVLPFARTLGAALLVFFLTLALGVQAQSESAGTIVLERSGGGASGGVLEARLNGKAMAVLYETDRIEHSLEPGSYRLEVRLLRSEGGREIFGIEPLQMPVDIPAGSQRKISVSVVPEALGSVIKASLEP